MRPPFFIAPPGPGLLLRTVGPGAGAMTKPKFTPRRILLLKTHSAGIGDILRSSAAWRVLHNAYPGVELHLILLTNEPGYSSERFIARHHLLAGFHALDKRTRGWAGWRRLLRQAGAVAAQCRPDLIIDFEPNGLRTTILARWLAARHGARTVGINEVFGRGLLYGRAACSRDQWAARLGVTRLTMDYTDRDFQALSALGLERAGTPIELAETPEGKAYRLGFRARFNLPPDAPLVGLNIGCGTPGAAERRPSLPLLSALAHHLQTRHGLHLVLGLGAPFESVVDQEFLAIHRSANSAPFTDLGGQASLLELVGLLQTCRFFISGDTGPYHLAVAVQTPTIAVFNFAHPVAYHRHPWVRCVVATQPGDAPSLLQAADELLAANPARPLP